MLKARHVWGIVWGTQPKGMNMDEKKIQDAADAINAQNALAEILRRGGLDGEAARIAKQPTKEPQCSHQPS
jgi:16S rRNA C1402 N4-methylase RsmH